MLFRTMDHRTYITERRTERMLGTSLLWALLMPPLSSSRLVLPLLWVPRKRWLAAVLGALGGAAEDMHARIAFVDTMRHREAREPELWTTRTLIPAFLFFMSPALILSCLDGELKGGNTALALLENRPIQSLPFFAVLDPYRHSEPHSRSPYRVRRRSEDENDMYVLTHLLSCRLSGGYYDIVRHPNNAKWRVV